MVVVCFTSEVGMKHDIQHCTYRKLIGLIMEIITSHFSNSGFVNILGRMNIKSVLKTNEKKTLKAYNLLLTNVDLHPRQGKTLQVGFFLKLSDRT